MKKIAYRQIGDLKNKNILDFGSGLGATACYYAEHNTVTAIEPDEESVNRRFSENDYTQLTGGLDVLKSLESNVFDVVFCHNVLEYACEREDIIRELHRVLKSGGMLSLIKHNRFGRVMQMVVLLDDFDSANRILEGESSNSANYGKINYYNDEDILKWCGGFFTEKIYGIRAFYDLQQNQELHSDSDWQNKMNDIEMRVSEIEEFRNIAFFHHLILRKN